jgi:hypothetical protein
VAFHDGRAAVHQDIDTAVSAARQSAYFCMPQRCTVRTQADVKASDEPILPDRVRAQTRRRTSRPVEVLLRHSAPTRGMDVTPARRPRCFGRTR